MRADRRLIVHIGVPKTGSTGLQDFIFLTRDRLLALGVSVPALGLAQHTGHRALCVAASTGADAAADYLKTALDGDDSPLVFLTNEGLSERGVLDNLLEALTQIGFAELEIVLCVRRQDSLIESMYVQDTAQGVNHGDLPDFVEYAIAAGHGAFGSMARTVLSSGLVDRLHVIDVGEGHKSPAERIMRLILDPAVVDEWSPMLSRRVNPRVPAPLWPLILAAARLSPRQAGSANRKSPLRRFAEILREREFPPARPAASPLSKELARDIRTRFAQENDLLRELTGVEIAFAARIDDSPRAVIDTRADAEEAAAMARHVLVSALQLAWEVSNTADRDWDLVLTDDERLLLDDYPWSPGWGPTPTD